MNSFTTSAKFNANAAKATLPLLTFPDPQAVSLSIRASALVFSDPKSQALLKLIERVAPSDATVLVIGETGTGKELIARHLHALSPRNIGPFAAINCGAFSESLVESELFGHERGAFTGAVTAKTGWFESANKGTLFLDEIGDLPLPTQVKLLRVLQEREVVRVGSRQATKIDVRLVAATNVNLEEAVRAGHFREDLYYRMKVVTLDLLPLRERPGDILPLTEHFMKVYSKRLGMQSPYLHDDTIDELVSYPWPGNIRELENVIHRALLVSDDKIVYPQDLSLPDIAQRLPSRSAAARAEFTTPPAVKPVSLESLLNSLYQENIPDLYQHISDTTIRTAFEFCGNNQVQTAKLLGITRNVVRAHLKQLQLIP